MQIEALEFLDFRNYQRLSFTPAPSLNLLIGSNGQGKTNLLEGLAVLAVGRSFRRARPLEMARWGAMRGVVAGMLRRQSTTSSARRIIAPRDNGVWAISGEGCPWARVIPFSWSDLAIVHGPPQARRDLLDGFSAKMYPAYAAALTRYRQVLARRNHLLQTTGRASDLAGRLEPWNEQLMSTGLEILGRRREAVHLLASEVNALYPALGGRAGTVEMTYVSALGEEAGREEFESRLRARLAEEIRRGQTLVGPHRDDVAIALDGRDVRIFGSRGQQRLMALSLRLAEVKPVADAVGSTPILLLDDALSELDPGVQGRLIDWVSGLGQVFLTAAAMETMIAAQSWEVEGGTVSDRGRPGALRGAA